MEMKSKGKQVIRETGYGCYVWELPSGEVLGDDDQFMLVFATEGDRSAINAITQEARSLGFPEGKPVFWPDVRPVTNEEYDEQLMRAEAGMTPDPFDIAAINEEMKAIRRGH